MVVEGLAETGALMPSELRAYMTHELGLSPHAVLREAVPLLLLDPEPAVRQAAAAVLEQVARPGDDLAGDAAADLAVRNWVPAGRARSDRPIDSQGARERGGVRAMEHRHRRWRSSARWWTAPGRRV